MWLFSSWSEAPCQNITVGISNCTAIHPECKSRFGPVTSTSYITKPRKPVVIAVGQESFQYPEIEITSRSFWLVFHKTNLNFF
jgi:hypothetical protein